MNIQAQIEEYITSQAEPKRTDMEALHKRILQVMPKARLWFLDGKDEKGKVVSNPNIGYGQQTINYHDGKTKEFYQIGISANTTGLSVYIMGIADKNYLPTHYAASIGKATVTGYCIKFKKLKDIHVEVLVEAIKAGLKYSGQGA